LTEAERKKMGINFLPKTLQEAIHAFDADPFIEAVIGQDLKAEFIKYKQQEWNDYHQTISDWEIERYTHLF
jgi:glutamine synthetase